MNDEYANMIDGSSLSKMADKVSNIRDAIPKHHIFTSPFALHQDVKLKPFGIVGTVTQVNWDRAGLQVRVRYFNDYKQVCFEWFNPDELEAIK